MTATATTRVAPHDMPAEKALLGSLLVNRAGILDAATIIRPDDFHSPIHAHIFAAVLHLDELSQPVDAVTVADRLAQQQLLDTVGGIEALTALILDTPSTGRAGHYATIIRRHSQLRQLLAITGEVIEDAYQAAGNAEDVIEHAQARIFALTAEGDTPATPLADAAADWVTHLQDMITNGAGPGGVRTGLTGLDDMLCGLRPGQLITIAGRPGSGKSILGAQIAIEAAAADIPVLLVTIEMSSDEITGRLVANLSRVPAARLRSGQLIDTDWPKIEKAVNRLADLPVQFLDQGTVTANHIRSHARRLASRGRLGLIVVDYLQLLTPTSRRENRQVEVAEMSGALKRLAREVHVPIIALAQLNRGLEGRADKRPTLSDLRESGAIENDSDVVIGIYRDDMYEKDSPDRGKAELIILKQRSGPTGTVLVEFYDWHGRFDNLRGAA